MKTNKKFKIGDPFFYLGHLCFVTVLSDEGTIANYHCKTRVFRHPLGETLDIKTFPVVLELEKLNQEFDSIYFDIFGNRTGFRYKLSKSIIDFETVQNKFDLLWEKLAELIIKYKSSPNTLHENAIKAARVELKMYANNIVNCMVGLEKAAKHSALFTELYHSELQLLLNKN